MAPTSKSTLVDSSATSRHAPTDGAPRRPSANGNGAGPKTAADPAVEQPRIGGVERVLDARPDTTDFRDRLFVPTLVEVPSRIDLDSYRRRKVPLLDQGREGACTGFGLATVAHYLLRRRRVRPDRIAVSPRMFYELAKRYDEWPGEEYEGSSARGAMKGWHKHGVCAENAWPYDPSRPDRRLTDARSADALARPLGAYFRVNHKDLVAMHSALAEVGILYATARVHAGWQEVGADGLIPFRAELLGGHAFAVVAFDEQGFWIQNSWGADWGHHGFARVSYDDWLANGSDVWVARLGVPIQLRTPEATAAINADVARQSEGYAYCDLRPHIVSLGNNGRLRDSGTYATSPEDVAAIFADTFPSATASWERKRLLLYAHGGLVGEQGAVQRVADYRAPLLDAEVYPVSFIWKTDFWSTLTSMLEDALAMRRPEGILDAGLDFMLDRLDDALEPITCVLGGKAQWDEMKENARLASESEDGGARLALDHLAALLDRDPAVEVHVAGHSAGSIFLAPLVRGLAQRGHRVASCTLWAPACTVDLFKETYLPAIRDGQIDRFALFTLSDDAEQDDHCANVYHKSLLYLVSNAFEDRPRIPLLRESGVPLLGMEKYVRKDAELRDLFAAEDVNADWILAPNAEPAGSARRSDARSHGEFDDDQATLRATLAHILEQSRTATTFPIHRSASSLRDRRALLAS